MDPSLFVASLSGIMQAVQVWYASRDAKSAQNAFRLGVEEAQNAPSFKDDVLFITRIVPPSILKLHTDRANRCFEDYQGTLEGGYSDQEIDRAIDSMKSCICRELRRILAIGEKIPPGQLSEAWRFYCSERGRFGEYFADVPLRPMSW